MTFDGALELMAAIARRQNDAWRTAEAKNLAARVRSGRVSMADIHRLSVILGENLSRALREELTDALLGGETAPQLIEQVLVDAMQRNYDEIESFGARVQRLLDARSGIGLNAVRAPFPLERIRGLAEKISGAGSPAEARKWLGEPVVNTMQSFSDDFMRANADFRGKAGMQAWIVRELGPAETRHVTVNRPDRKTPERREYFIPCPWCESLAGKYRYGDEPEDVYRRHEYCRCTVTFRSERQQQNVWTKETWKPSEEALQRRRSAGMDNIRR